MQYMGSKSRFAKEIVPMIQNYIDQNKITNYYEPFVGGANIIDKIQCENKYGSDNSHYLIECLKEISNPLFDVSKIPETILFDDYCKVRESYKSKDGVYPDWYIGLVGFCASYGNRFFDGGYARNSASDTTGERPKSAFKKCLQQIPSLQEIQFQELSYFDLECENSLIYCDPPYKDTTQYLTSKNFDYDRYYEWVRRMSQNNIVICSEYNMPSDFTCIWEKHTKITIAKNAKSKGIQRVEKLFVYQGTCKDQVKEKSNTKIKIKIKN